MKAVSNKPIKQKFLKLVLMLKLNSPFRGLGGYKKKSADYLHRTAQPPVLAAFRPWGGSAGAGRARPAGRKGNGYKLIFLKEIETFN
jgi:hypothetical protein